MIEKTVIDFLTDELDVPVYAETPETVPGEYVIVEKTGGSMRDHIWTATLAIRSIAASLYDAAALNEAVIWAMLVLGTLPTVSSCRLNSDYNFTNTATKEYRYQAVFDVVYFNEED